MYTGSDGFLHDHIIEIRNSPEYRMFSGAIELIERGCHCRAVHRLARVGFRLFKMKVMKMMKHLGDREKVDLLKKIKVYMPSFGRAFTILSH